MSDRGINKSIHAVIQWSWDDETHSLIDRDVNFVKNGDLVEAVTNDVFDHIRRRLFH